MYYNLHVATYIVPDREFGHYTTVHVHTVYTMYNMLHETTVPSVNIYWTTYARADAHNYNNIIMM